MKNRLPLLVPYRLDRGQRALYDRIAESVEPWAKKNGFAALSGDGSLLGPFNALLYSPTVSATSMDYFDSDRAHSTLSASVREVIILTVASFFGSEYEIYAHMLVASKMSVNQETVHAIVDDRVSAESSMIDSERLAYLFVHAFLHEHRVSAELYSRAEQTFGRQGLVDIVHLTSLYMMTSMVLNVFEVPAPG